MHWLVFALLNAFFESLGNALSKHGVQKMDVLAVVWAQRFFSLAFLFPITLITNSFQTVNEAFWIALFWAIIFNAITSLLFIKAIKTSPISLTLPIVSFTPAFLLITSPIMLGEYPTTLSLVGILISIAGSYILNLSKRTKNPFEPLLSIIKEKGPRLMLIVAFLWGISSNIAKTAVINSNPILFAFAISMGICLIFTAIILYQNHSLKHIFQNTKILAPVGFALGISSIFQNIAITMTTVPNVITVKRTSALFGVMWGKLFFKEDNIKERFLGTAIMIVGVILTAMG